MSAPFHPATNGLAECAVQIVKKGLKKVKEGTMANRIARVLMTYRVTPQSTTGTSPAVLLQGRRIRTCLDLLKANITGKVEQQQMKQKSSHDRACRSMFFAKGETVYAQNFGTGQKWVPAVVQEVTGPVSFLVKLRDGRLIRRHQDHLRRRVSDNEDERPEPSDIPEVLVDAAPTAHNTEQKAPESLAIDTEVLEPTEATPEPRPASSPVETESTVNDAGGTRVPPSVDRKSYPRRSRKKSDWFHFEQ